MIISANKKILLPALALTATLFFNGCSNDQADNSKQAAIHMVTSSSYLNQGQYRAAIIEARNVIKYSPKTAEGYIALANIYNKLGNGAAAVEVLHPMLSDFPLKLNLTLAKGYALSGKFRSALEQLDKNTPPSTEAKTLRAQSLAGLQQYDQAKNLYSQLLSQDQTNTEAQLGMIKIFLITGNAKQAALDTNKLLKQEPNNTEALFLKAQLAYQINDLESSERYLTEALQYLPQSDVLTPLKSRILQHLADTLTQLGHPSEALIYTKILAEANPEAHQAKQKFNQALILYQSGELDKAEELLLNLYKEYPTNAMSGMLLGMINLQQGDLVKAGEFLSDNVDAETSSSKIINSTALTQLQLNQPEKAVVLLEEALKSHPNDASSHAIYGLAVLNINPTDNKGAIALHKALAIDPNRYKLHTVLARHYLALNKPEQAYTQFNVALKKQPTDNELQNNYINALLQNSNGEKAIQLAQTFINQSPQNPKVYLQAAKASLYTKDLSRAEAHLKKSISLDRNNVAALLGLGQLQLINKQWVTATGSFRKALAEEPSTRAYKGLITSQEAQQKGAQIIAELTDSANDESTNSTLLAVLAEYHARNNNTEKAVEYAGKAVAKGNITGYVRNTASTIYRAIAKRLLMEGNAPAARSKLSAALELTPNNPRLMSDLVTLEITIKNFSEATKVAAQIELNLPEKPIGKYLKGLVHSAQKQWPEATEDLKAAWDIQASDTVGALYYKALIKSGSPQQADTLLDNWIEQRPNSAKPLTLKGIALQQNNANSSAIDYYKQALTLDPKDTIALNNLAWLYFTLGDSQALALAQQALELAPNSASVLDTAGWIIANSGQKESGIKLLEKANKLSKGKEAEIIEHLEQARQL